MLPDYEYKHYYDQLCDFCEDVMVSLDERVEDGGECRQCNKTICYDCRDGLQCDGTECGGTFCDGCLEGVGDCEFCPDLRFCEDCLPEHVQSCTPLTRAERRLHNLTESLEFKHRENDRLKQRLRELSQELEDTNKETEDAERLVNKLRRQQPK